MEQCDDRFHIRKHPRLRHYDYAQPGYYFVTICTSDKRCIFGEPENWNCFGKIAMEGLVKIPDHFPEVLVDKWVVMPNHVHVIIHLNDCTTELSHVIGQYKSAVTRNIRRIVENMTVWQTSYHDHVIRSERDYLRIWEYIDTNPSRWKDDCFYTE